MGKVQVLMTKWRMLVWSCSPSNVLRMIPAWVYCVEVCTRVVVHCNSSWRTGQLSSDYGGIVFRPRPPVPHPSTPTTPPHFSSLGLTSDTGGEETADADRDMDEAFGRRAVESHYLLAS